MTLPLRPERGGFLRPFGCGWFIREFLLGNGPQGAPTIDIEKGSTQSDINYHYKEALARVIAREKAERLVDKLVVKSKDVTEEQAEEMYQRELRKVSRKFSHMRYHSFLVYFSVIKKLGWVERTGETEASAIQDNYSEAPDRTYYRLTEKGRQASLASWSNPLFTLYPGLNSNHQKR
jgi:hypothetical protein